MGGRRYLEGGEALVTFPGPHPLIWWVTPCVMKTVAYGRKKKARCHQTG
jgi:hypothetical protein